MTQLRGIEADFATWRPVQGRKVLQLIFEVPIENTQHVLDTLGIPQPGQSKWCAIALLAKKLGQAGEPQALLTPPKEAANGLDSASTSQANEGGGSTKKSWAEYARSQQAAILCHDHQFREYFGVISYDVADHELKKHLRIKSKTDLDKDPEAGARFDEFVAIYNMKRPK